MTELPLPELEAERDRLYAQLSAVGDFRRGLPSMPGLGLISSLACVPSIP